MKQNTILERVITIFLKIKSNRNNNFFLLAGRMFLRKLIRIVPFFIIVFTVACSYDSGGFYTHESAVPEKLALTLFGIPPMLMENRKGQISDEMFEAEIQEYEKNTRARAEKKLNKYYPAGTAIKEIIDEWRPFGIICSETEKVVVCELSKTRTHHVWSNVIIFSLPNEKSTFVECESKWTTFIRLTLLGNKQLEHMKLERSSNSVSCPKKK